MQNYVPCLRGGFSNLIDSRNKHHFEMGEVRMLKPAVIGYLATKRAEHVSQPALMSLVTQPISSHLIGCQAAVATLHKKHSQKINNGN